MTAAGWHVVAAAVPGTSHLRIGLPCQDAFECSVSEDPGGTQTLVIVVSDGAGSAKHADIGSRLACSVIQQEVESFLRDGGSAKGVTREVATRWFEKLSDSLVDKCEEISANVSDLACTLLVAVVGETAAAFLQLGDGAIVVLDPDVREYSWMFWPENGEYINTTIFVTSPSAVTQFEFAVVPRAIEQVSVFTDGIQGLVLHYQARSVHQPFFVDMFKSLLTSRSDDLRLSQALSTYLTSDAISERTDDDKTLVLAVRKPVLHPMPASNDEVPAPSNACD